MLTTTDTFHTHREAAALAADVLLECPACGKTVAAEELAESDVCLVCLDDADQIAEAEHALDWARGGDLDLPF